MPLDALRRTPPVAWAILAIAVLGAAAFVVSDGMVTDDGGSPGSSDEPGHYVRSFTEDSYWNTPLPPDAPPHPEGDRLVAWLAQHAPDGIALHGFDGNRWGMPAFVTDAEDPVWSIDLATVTPQSEVVEEDGLHIPDRIEDVITGTSDSPAVVIDTARGYEVELFRVRQVGERSLAAESAAIYWLDGNGLAHDPEVNPDGDRRNWGHRGVAPSAMVIRDEEIRAGRIDHVLELYVPGTAECNVAPMVGYEPARGGVICEGSRLRIRPEIDLDAFGLSPDAMVVARALQEYGAIVGDNSGVPAAVLKVEQDHGQWNDVDLQRLSLQEIPWEAFEFVRDRWTP